MIQHKYVEAETTIRPALKEYEAVNSQAWDRYDGYSLLGLSLVGQKKGREAESLLISDYEGMTQREATTTVENRQYKANAQKALGRLYEDWGMPEKATESQFKGQQLTIGAFTAPQNIATTHIQ